MNGLKAHLWKEWRDRKALLIGIAIALPILDLIVLAAFGERFGKVFGDPSNGTAYSFEGVVALPAAVLVFLFTVAADLFGTERRQGTLTLLQRVPGGTLRAFGAKVLFLVATLLAVMVWQIASVMFAWLCLGEPSRAWLVARTARLHLQEPELLIWFLTAALCLSLWIALVSNWIPRSGAAAVGALALLAVLFAPLFWIFENYPGFWPWRVSRFGSDVPRFFRLYGATWIPAAIAGLSLLLSALTFLRWSRFSRSSLAVAWRGLAIALVLFGIGYGYSAKALAEYARIDPADPSFWMQSAVIGSSERYALIEVDNRYNHWRSGVWRRSPPGSEQSPWLVDLETGRWSPVGESGGHVGHIHFALRPQSVEPWIVYEASTAETQMIRWVDLQTGGSSPLTAPDSKDSQLHWRTLARERSWSQDTGGRSVWIEDSGRIAREESDGSVSHVPGKGLGAFPRYVTVPGGWIVSKDGRYSRVSSDTGEDLGLLPQTVQPQRPEVPRLFTPLSVSHAWIQVRPSNSDPDPPGFLVDLETGHEEHLTPPGEVLMAIDAENLLVLAEDETTLLFWNPGSGEQQPVTWDREIGPIPNASVDPQTFYALEAAERLLTGEVLIYLSHIEGDRSAIGLLDPENRSGRVVTPWKSYNFYRPVCITETGALWCIEEGRRLVRFENGERKVFFPREDS